MGAWTIGVIKLLKIILLLLKMKIKNFILKVSLLEILKRKYFILQIPWKGGGGSFAIKGHDEQGRISMNTPLYKGHTGPIQDMEFSPFHENMLATASSDATIRLWAMPEG